MRLRNILISIASTALLIGCMNAGENNRSSFDLSDTNNDTLIYSSPANYFKGFG